MYSKYRLQVAYDPSRKISDIQTDINNEYIVRIVPVVDLSLSFGEYAKNFYSAATKIAEFLLESDDSDACQMDSFFFPLAFLYRHSIELYLKGIVF